MGHMHGIRGAACFFVKISNTSENASEVLNITLQDEAKKPRVIKALSSGDDSFQARYLLCTLHTLIQTPELENSFAVWNIRYLVFDRRCLSLRSEERPPSGLPGLFSKPGLVMVALYGMASLRRPIYFMLAYFHGNLPYCAHPGSGRVHEIIYHYRGLAVWHYWPSHLAERHTSNPLEILWARVPSRSLLQLSIQR